MTSSPDDLRAEESSLAQILDVLDEAGRLVTDGQPRWVDPDVFGSTVRGERLARHTLRAQDRVQEALHMALQALAQHHGALATFRDDVRRVESESVDETSQVRSRLDAL